MGTLIFFFFRVSFTQHLLRLCSFSTVSSFDLLHLLLLLLLHLCRRRLFVVVFVYPIFLPWAYLWFGKTKQNINKFEKKNSVTSRVFFRKLPSAKTLTSRRLSLSLSSRYLLYSFSVPLSETEHSFASFRNKDFVGHSSFVLLLVFRFIVRVCLNL